MEKINIKQAKLHDSFHIGGKNFTGVLDTTTVAGLKLVYDREHKELLIGFNGKGGIVPSTNVSCMEPLDVKDVGIDLAVPTPTPRVRATPPTPAAPKAKAQVSDPTKDTVFGGPGAGQTGIGGKVQS